MSSTPPIGEQKSTLPLFFQKRFLPMWTALCLGAFTDNMLKQALSIALVYGTLTAPFIDNDAALPLVGLLFPLPMAIFSTISGQIADKYETSFLFRRTKFAEFLLMVLAAIGFLLGNTAILIATLFLMGVQSAFFSPVRTSAMPKYLTPGELVRGNAFSSGGLFVSVMIGIVLGGMLINQPNGPATVSLVLVLAAFTGWLVIRMTPQAAPNDPDLKIDWNVFRQVGVLLKYPANSPGVMRPVLGSAWYWTVGAFVSVAVPIMARDTLYGDENVTTALMGLFALGAAIGAVTAASLAKGRSGLGFSTGGILLAGTLSIIIFFLAIGVKPPVGADTYTPATFFKGPREWIMAFSFLISSAAMAVYAVPLQAAVQRRAPPAIRARVLAANNFLNAVGAIFGFLLFLAITQTSLEAKLVFPIVGSAQLVVAAYMFNRRRTQPEGLYDESLTGDEAPTIDQSLIKEEAPR